MEKIFIFILIFIWHFIFFAEGSCDNYKTDVVLPFAPIIIVKYFRKNVFKNKLTRVFFLPQVKCLYPSTMAPFYSPSHAFTVLSAAYFTR